MKRILLALCIVLSVLPSMAQTITGDRIIGRQSWYLRDWWVDSVKRDTSFLGFVKSLPTADAVYRFIQGRTNSTWFLNGNSGTTPSGNFLGTTDSAGLRIKVNNKDAGYLSRSGFGASGIVVSYTGAYTTYGQMAGYTLTPKVAAGTETGSANTLIGEGAGLYLSADYDTSASTTSSENTMIGVGSGHFTQKRSFITNNGRNILIGGSTCFSCLTPGENVAVGYAAMASGSRPTYNVAVGSNALRTSGSSLGMTSLGAYASAYTGGIISSATVTAGGNYTSAPTVSFSAPYAGGDPGSCYATATGYAVMSFNGVDSSVASIVITNPGCGYNNITGTFYPGYTNYFPTVSFSGGGGTGAAATAVVLSGSNTTAVGRGAGWLSRAPQYNIYIGSAAQTETRYFDEWSAAIGSYSGIDASVSTLQALHNAWAIGSYAKVSTSNTFVIGRPYTDTAGSYLVAINNKTGDSTFSVYGNSAVGGGSISATGGIRTDKDGRIHTLTVGLGRADIATNTALGFEALNSITTGNSETAVGYQALKAATSGSLNTAVGYQALTAFQSGSGANVAVGYWALKSNVLRSNNVGVGQQSLSGLVETVGNVAVGSAALYQYTGTGSISGGGNNYGYNTSMGYLSGASNTNGVTNTFVGSYAGSGIQTGYRNIVIGSSAFGGLDPGTGGTTTSSSIDNVVIGVQALCATTAGGHNIAIGNTSMRAANPSVGYNIVIGDAAGGSIGTGNYNVILGGYSGAGLANKSNHTIIADGAGNIRAHWDSTGAMVVGNGATDPATTSLLDLTSTSRGFLAPRMTAAQRLAISSPATGLLVYDTDSSRYMLYVGSGWKGIKFTDEGGGGGGTPGGSDKQIQYNNSGSFAGATGFEVGNTNQRVRIESQSSSEVPLVVRGHSSYTPNIAEFQSSGGTYTLAWVGPSGQLTSLQNITAFYGQNESVTIGYTNIGKASVAFGQSSNTYIWKSNTNELTFGSDGSAQDGTIKVGSVNMNGRFLEKQGADVASANNLTLGTDGNTFEITGTTQVNLISNTNWQTGSTITLLLPSGITIKHGQTTSGSNITILLSGAADLVTAAASSLTLVYSEFGGTNAWRQVGSVISY